MPEMEKSNYEEVLSHFMNTDALILGEEHNDTMGHSEKYQLIQYLWKERTFCISMEMFETDQQFLLNEYMLGLMDETTFKENLRLWSNYEKDYKPIIEFAKENNIYVMASNAPRRYVRLVSKFGIKKLFSLPFGALQYLPPLNSLDEFSDSAYNKKFINLMGGMEGTHSTQIENFLQAQNLWDATMAYSIKNYFQRSKVPVIHINGRFHSDEKMGIYSRLQKYGLKVKSITYIPIKAGTQIQLQNYKQIADFVVFTQN
jgi:uncharacterized iron-regulated protein